MMKRTEILVFSGTTEGREISDFIREKGIGVTVCVATEYGRSLMKEQEGVKVLAGRLSMEEMEQLPGDFGLCIDATHPYASLVTENIKKACKKRNIPYIRLLREEACIDRNPACGEGLTEDFIHVGSVREAAEYLREKAGEDKIFISTGSKEIEEYCIIPDYEKRLTVRVLPVEESLDKCRSHKILNIIGEKGPFSYERNLFHFKASKALWLVTKEAGKSGGFEEKIRAAGVLLMKVIIVDRPAIEEGLSLGETKGYIEKWQKQRS